MGQSVTLPTSLALPLATVQNVRPCIEGLIEVMYIPVHKLDHATTVAP